MMGGTWDTLHHKLKEICVKFKGYLVPQFSENYTFSFSQPSAKLLIENILMISEGQTSS